jgi:hypothetical protein
MIDLNTEGKKLKRVMAERSLRTGEVAALAGIGRGTLYNIICHGQKYKCWPAREKVNKALGVEIFTRPMAGRPGRRKSGHLGNLPEGLKKTIGAAIGAEIKKG